MMQLPEFDRLDWYALMTPAELKARAKLEALGYTVWLPSKHVQVQRSRHSKAKTRTIEVATIAGYVFLGVDGEIEWPPVLALEEVAGVIMEHRCWNPKDEEDVPPRQREWMEPARLRAGWERGLVWEVRGDAPPPPDFAPGDAVNIVGPFADYPAKVLSIDGRFARVLVTIFGRDIETAAEATTLRKRRVVSRA